MELFLALLENELFLFFLVVIASYLPVYIKKRTKRFIKPLFEKKNSVKQN